MTMAKRLFVLCLTLVLSGCSLDPSTPSTFRPEDQISQAALAAPPAYSARSRQRERELQSDMLPIIVAAKRRTAEIFAQVDEAVSALPAPQRYSTREPELRRFHESQQDVYAEVVRGIYDEALAQLDSLHGSSIVRGEALAQALAEERSPLDAGASGDPLLDRQLRSFEDTLRMTLDRDRLEALGFEQVGNRVEKLEIFSSFTTEGADAALGGRLMLFLSSNSQTDLPLCDVVLRTEPGVAPADRGLVQAVRFRIMAGTTVIEDLGWALFPEGLPPADVWHDRYLIAPDLAPKVLEGTAGYDQLRSLRVVADVQTAVFDRSRTVLGGMDWRLEFRVSSRGELTWQQSAVQPAYNETCDEAGRLLKKQ